MDVGQKGTRFQKNYFDKPQQNGQIIGKTNPRNGEDQKGTNSRMDKPGAGKDKPLNGRGLEKPLKYKFLDNPQNKKFWTTPRIQILGQPIEWTNHKNQDKQTLEWKQARMRQDKPKNKDK